jgi:hypothetical protein
MLDFNQYQLDTNQFLLLYCSIKHVLKHIDVSIVSTGKKNFQETHCRELYNPIVGFFFVTLHKISTHFNHFIINIRSKVYFVV